jgi:membrane protein implicated in regulation of membrane protease activity
MTESTLWWIATGAAIALELLSGTFYLLMLSIGLASAALAANFGASLTTQLTVAALVGGGAVVACYLVRKKTTEISNTGSNRNVNLDVGETLQVDSWNADGTASVKYRGAQWSAVRASGTLPSTGAHRIVEVRGSQLVLEKHQP